MEREFVSVRQASEALKISSRSLQRLCDRYPAIRRKQDGRQVLVCIEELLNVLKKKA